MVRFLSLILTLFCWNATTFALSVTHLRTEYLENPIGIDYTHPRVSWQLVSETPNTLQKAYQLVVYRESGGLKEVWNSGKVDADQSHLVALTGLELLSKTTYYWKVKVWDNHGNESSFGTLASFETGMLSANEWRATWIAAPWNEVFQEPSKVKYFRRAFDVKKKVKSARLYITSQGLYEAYLNGEKIGDQEMTPGWTSYETRLQYQVFDVTEGCKNGLNALAVMVADGWHRGRINYRGKENPFKEQLALLAQLEIEYEGGKKTRFTTDKHWKVGTGGYQEATIYDGVVFDTALEPKGWKSSNFDDSDWEKVKVLDQGYDHLVGSHAPPVRVVKTIPSVGARAIGDKEVIFDFGQNLVGRVTLQVECYEPGTAVIEHGEILGPDGDLYTKNLRGAKARVSVTVPGNGNFEYTPSFTFMGFRYIKVTGISRYRVHKVTAQVLSSDLEDVGSFKCSEPLLNRLYKNVVWSQRGNFLDVPTDCPQRDERMGWTGDAQVFFPTATLNMDVAAFFRKWLQDLKADQHEDGSLPWVIPDVFDRQREPSTGWADAATIIPWEFYQRYGDRRILEEQYVSMKAWVEYMVRGAKDNLWFGKRHFGDWLSYFPEEKPHVRAAVTEDQLLAQIFYQHSLQLMISTAKVLGNKEDLGRYQELFKAANTAFYNEFVTPNGRLVSGTQTAYALALSFELLHIEDRQQAVERLVDNIEVYGHISTGFLGTPYLCHILSKYGRSDEAYRLLLNEEYPSWLYTVKNGATTIWERWDGIKPDRTLQNPRVNSFNHYAYGAIGSWMIERAAGIQLNPLVPGYKEFIIAPEITDSLKHLSADFKCNYGKILSQWKHAENGLEMELEIPANTRATIRTPKGYSIVQILVKQNDQIVPVNFATEIGAEISLGSGQYQMKLIESKSSSAD